MYKQWHNTCFYPLECPQCYKLFTNQYKVHRIPLPATADIEDLKLKFLQRHCALPSAVGKNTDDMVLRG